MHGGSQIDIHLTKDIQLRKAEYPYVVKKIANVNTSETEEIFKKVRNILNKLTPQNLPKLTSDLMKLAINSEDRLKGATDIIFEKVAFNFTIFKE